MHTVEIEKQSYNIRSGWSEMPPGLLLLCMPHIIAERDTGAAELVAILSDIPEEVLSLLAPWQYAKLMPFVYWVWDEPLTTPILPHFVHEGNTYHLPSAELMNSSLVEFDHAEQFLRDILDESPEPLALESLIAALCRIESGEDPYDARMRFDARRIPKDAEQFRTLSPHIKFYVLWFFQGCYTKIRKDYEILWKSDDKAPDQFAEYSLQKEEWIEFGWVGAAFEAAEEGAFGTFEQVLFTDVHTMFYYFSFKKQQAEKMKAKYNKKSPAKRLS